MGPVELLEVEDYHLEKYSGFAPIQRYLSLIQKQPTNISESIRVQRHRAWLKSALATLEQKTETDVVCKFWSQQTDKILQLAWRECGCEKYDMSLFAFGKLGSEELNMSSDIDLLVVSELEASSEQLQSYKRFHALISENTNFGFAFRIDNDLRPGGRHSPLVCGIKQFTEYYWTQGAPWEKLALIRLRYICGREQLANEVLALRDQFAYRKYLDYTLAREYKSLRSKIHQQNSTETRNLKLGKGGIRDIELFVHCLQTIWGGKHPEVKTHSTTRAIAQLKNKKIITAEDAEQLNECYWQLRSAENLVQIINDQQTHSWPKTTPSLSVYQRYNTEIDQILFRVDKIVSDLLGPYESDDQDTLPSTLEKQIEWLNEIGFQGPQLEDNWAKLINLKVKSKDSRQDEAERGRFLKTFVPKLYGKSINPEAGLLLLHEFINATRAKATFFSLLNSDPVLQDDLALIFSTSPYLANILASRPELIDNFIYKTQAKLSQDIELATEALVERKLLAEIFSAIDLLKNLSDASAFEQLSKNADSICLDLLRLIKETQDKSTLEVLSLGKWGGNELGLRSDLDFVFVTEENINESDHKVAKRFLSRLQDQHKGGKIYDFDLRLRPSGNAGPLIVTREQLEEFLVEKSEAWLRQSYLKARYIDRKCKAFSPNFIDKGLSGAELNELRNIRTKLLKAKTSDSLDLKKHPGGILEVEFACQIFYLFNKIAPPSTNTANCIKSIMQQNNDWEAHGAQLLTNYRSLRLYEQVHQILSLQSTSQIKFNSQSFLNLAKVFQLSPAQLRTHIERLLDENIAAVKQLDPIYLNS